MVEKVDEIVGEQNDNNDAQDGHEMVYRINKCEAINSKNPFSYYERSASTLDRSFSEDSSSIRQPLLVTYSQDTASSVIVSTPSSCSEQTICEARQKTSQHKHVFTDESDVEARAGQRRKVFRARYTKKFLEKVSKAKGCQGYQGYQWNQGYIGYQGQQGYLVYQVYQGYHRYQGY